MFQTQALIPFPHQNILRSLVSLGRWELRSPSNNTIDKPRCIPSFHLSTGFCADLPHQFAHFTICLRQRLPTGLSGAVILAYLTVDHPAFRLQKALSLQPVQHRVKCPRAEAVTVPGKLPNQVQSEDGFLRGVIQDVQTDEPQEKVAKDSIRFRYRHAIMVTLRIKKSRIDLNLMRIEPIGEAIRSGHYKLKREGRVFWYGCNVLGVKREYVSHNYPCNPRV